MLAHSAPPLAPGLHPEGERRRFWSLQCFQCEPHCRGVLYRAAKLRFRQVAPDKQRRNCQNKGGNCQGGNWGGEIQTELWWKPTYSNGQMLISNSEGRQTDQAMCQQCVTVTLRCESVFLKAKALLQNNAHVSRIFFEGVFFAHVVGPGIGDTMFVTETMLCILGSPFRVLGCSLVWLSRQLRA